MGAVWTDENRLAKWLEVELAATDALAEAGELPAEVAKELRAKAKVPSAERVAEIEKETRHDLIAFTLAVEEQAGEVGRHLHYGLTSSDVLDTATALILRDANQLIREGIEKLAAALKQRAQEHKATPMIGRTHGVHAEPTTFGLVLANFFSELQRDSERFEMAAAQMNVGAISGAVGTYPHLGPEIEVGICRKLGIEPAAVSTQVIQRDRHAFYLSTLAVLAATMEKIALEVRHLQRTEVREAEESFGKGQRGSSAMPHKKNPINSENLCGLARLVRSNSFAAMENVALWHERDISHSSVERVILPDSTILVDFMLHRTADLIANLRVYPKNMQRNLDLSRGLVFSGGVLLALVRSGVERREAYTWVQENAMKVWEGEKDFKTLLLKDKRVTGKVSEKEIEACFDLKHQLRHVDTIFNRVFG
jgi:adenylosuccinate lyase